MAYSIPRDAVAPGVGCIGEPTVVGHDQPAGSRFGGRHRTVDECRLAIGPEVVGRNGAGVRGASCGFRDDQAACRIELETERGDPADSLILPGVATPEAETP